MDEEPTTDATPLGELFPGMVDLPGEPTHDTIGGPLRSYLERRGELTWAGLGALSPSEIAQLPHLGPVRTKRILSNLSTLMGAQSVRRERLAGSSATDSAQRLLSAVEEVAAWAVGNGRAGSVLDALLEAVRSDASDRPFAELQILSELPAADVAPPALVRCYDPVIAATEMIAAFDERERAILDRVLDFDGSAPTLQEIGDRFEVSRERIRQIEIKVRRRLDTALAERDMRALVAAADRLRERLGAAVPAGLLAVEFAAYPPDLLDRLILHLAGPYHFDGDWYVLSAVGDFAAAVMSAFESVADKGVASAAALTDALVALGVRPEHVDRVITGDARFRVMEDTVIDWRGSMAAKAVLCLGLAGAPLSMEEIAEFVRPSSEQGMLNQIYAGGQIIKVGKGRYALAEWDMERFPGIEPTLAARLADGPRPLDVLSAELADAYGVSPNSVHAIASTHPGFLVEDGQVMLRPPDRPYIPSSDLERTRACYSIEGVWTWRTEVTTDLLRGIGPRLPEAFAVHLGGSPLSRGSITSPVGSIGLSWARQPQIGSLRAAARSLDAEEGDWLFVRRVRPSAIDFMLVRAGDLGDEPEQRLRGLIGAPGSTVELEQVLADALGLRGSVNHDLAEERAALLARREQDLVELLDALTG